MLNPESDWFVETVVNLIKESKIDLTKIKLEAILSEAIIDSLPITSQILLESLKKDAPRMLEEHAEIRNGFEARLLNKWRIPLNLLEMLIVISIESAEMFPMNYESNDIIEHIYVLQALEKIHARACQVSNEILCLIRGGFADGAFARWRTLYELATVSFFITKHGNKVAERYLEYEDIESYYLMKEYQKYCVHLSHEPLTAVEIKKVTDKRDFLIAKYGEGFDKSFGWAANVLSKQKRNFRGIEEDVGLDHLRPYYKLSCNYIHPGPKGNNYKMGVINNRLNNLFLCGPTNYGFADAGQNTAISLYQITTCYLTVEPTYDKLMILNVLYALCDEIDNAFVSVQREIEKEEDTEVKKRYRISRRYGRRSKNLRMLDCR